jgi:phosphoglycolate phosphatase
MTPTILLDLDGTLSDNFAGISRSILHALGSIGAPTPPESELRLCVGPPCASPSRA